jgi:hypothetical protein
MHPHLYRPKEPVNFGLVVWDNGSKQKVTNRYIYRLAQVSTIGIKKLVDKR